MSIALRVSSRRAIAAGVALVVSAPLVLAAVMGEGNPAHMLQLTSGGAWLPSPGRGLVELVDGPTSSVAGAVRALDDGSAANWSVTQAGSSAFIANSTRGTVSRIDGANDEVRDETQYGDPDDGLTLLQGGEGLYVVNERRRSADRVDLHTLQRERSFPLSALPGPAQAVVDDRGTLWVVDSVGGGLTWVDDDRHSDRDAAVERTGWSWSEVGRCSCRRTGAGRRDRSVGPTSAPGRA